MLRRLLASARRGVVKTFRWASLVATDSDRLQSKRADAISRINALVTFLDQHDLAGWGDRFRKIVSELQRGNDRMAITLDKAIPRGGMGSLTDIYIGHGTDDGELDREFHRLTGDASRCIANIRLYLDYEMDRPLVGP